MRDALRMHEFFGRRFFSFKVNGKVPGKVAPQVKSRFVT
jgi:hypothetical protein